MGQLVSSMLGSVAPAQSEPPPPPRVVLVPPFFQRDVRGLSRFCHSSYDYLANRKQLSRLLRDHLTPKLRGTLLLSPPDDPRVSVRAKLRRSGGSMVLRWQPSSAAALHSFIEMAASLDSPGDVSLRGSYLHPGSGWGAFLRAPLAADVSGEAAQVGVRYSSPDATAGAIFVPRRGELHKLWLAGRLYGFTLGLQLSPELPVRHALAALSGDGPAAAPPPPASGAAAAAAPVSGGGIGSGLADLKSWFRSHGSVLLAYSPPTRTGAVGTPFTASVEMAEGGALTFSFFQHVAATRQVVNPFEEDEVVGITNYLDIGLQLTTAIGPGAAAAAAAAASAKSLIRPVRSSEATATTTTTTTTTTTATTATGVQSGPGSGPGSASGVAPPTAAPAATVAGRVAAGDGGDGAQPATINLAASWQINKNWLLKARVGSQGAAAAVGARVWHAVSAYLTASVSVDYAHMAKPRYGMELCVENFGPLRYERGADDVAAGRALLQRHEASAQDLDNFAGRGVLIRRSTKQNTTDRTAGGGGRLEEERRRVAMLM
ncbi:hypothetical protein PLESTM_001928800 [Pleodorina starrii]|nr:hypothetical protein PLESTM_001928800 [Pleodorina starrii]